MSGKTTIGVLTAVAVLFATTAAGGLSAATSADRNAYFGDTHIHTMYSFDAFMGNVRTTPDDAYRYAKGEPIDHAAGMKLRISGPPLDFLMVSDHAKYLGVFAAQLDPDSPVYGHPDAQDLVPRGTPLDGTVARLRALEAQEPEFMGPAVSRYAWEKIVGAAQRHNDPPAPETSRHPVRAVPMAPPRHFQT